MSKGKPPPPPPPADAHWLSREQLAGLLGCQISTIKDLLRRKQIPQPVRLSVKFLRWSRRSVEEHLRRLEQGVQHVAS
jgi:predicted DNA-binding transcriptional regulator AlpA